MLLLCLLNHEFLRGNNCLISFSRYKKGEKCSSFAIFAHKSFQFLLYNTRSLENRSTFFTTFGAKIQIRLVLADFHTLSEGLVSHFWSFVLVRKTFFNVPQSLRLVWQDEEWFYCQWFFLSLLSTNQAHGWMFEHIQLHYKSMCEILGQSKNSSDAKYGIKIRKLTYSLIP